SATCQSKMRDDGSRPRTLVTSLLLVVTGLMPNASLADEGGVSFWLPGLYGSLAAVPASAPGWALGTFLYNTSVHAGADVSDAREITIGRFNPRLNINLSANLNSDVPLLWINPSYVFATPFLGGQASVGIGGFVGHSRTALSGTVTATIPPFSFVRSDSI